MNESGYYPPGAENDSNAPYNEKKEKTIMVPVTISINMSIDTDVCVIENYTELDLKEAVKDQIYLPIDKHEKFTNWTVDAFEIIEIK